MKKNSLVFSLVILLLFVSISGCQEQSNQKGNHQTNNSTNNTNGNQQSSENLFLGDWKVIDSSSDYETWSFYTNLSAKNHLIGEFEGEQLITTTWFDYTNDTTTLCLSTKNETPDSPNYFSTCYPYLFSENATHLTLSSDDIVIIELVKMLPE